MENRYTVSIVHGEARSLFHVVDGGAPEAEQPCILVTLHDPDKAREVAATLNEQAARIRELEGSLRECVSALASDEESGLVMLPECVTALGHARRIIAEGGKP